MARCPAHFGGNPGRPQRAFPLHRKHDPLGNDGQHRNNGPHAQSVLISRPTPENATRSSPGPTLQHTKNTRHTDKGIPLILWRVFFGAVPLPQQPMRKKAQKSRIPINMEQLHNPSDRESDHAAESPSVLPHRSNGLRGKGKVWAVPAVPYSFLTLPPATLLEDISKSGRRRWRPNQHGDDQAGCRSNGKRHQACGKEA